MSHHPWTILAALVVGATLSMPAATLGGPKAPLKFVWPVQGRLTVGFCQSPDNARDYGINLAVSPGTEVHAAEGGEIVYAGNELKGYRNLILISHAEGWVSAYAQSDEMLVTRRDTVQRGQVIARFGHPDPGESLRLRFGLRKDGTPVDPVVYLGSADDHVAAPEVGCRG